MQQTPLRRLVSVGVVKANRRPPLCPIPPAVFLEPVYIDDQPYDDADADPEAAQE